jgi:hypothetical protein
MIILGRHDGDPFGFGGLGEPVVDAELVSDGGAELALQLVDFGGQARQVKDCALQEGSILRRGGMLVQGDDVGPGLAQEGADGRDDSGAVMATKQQASDVWAWLVRC